MNKKQRAILRFKERDFIDQFLNTIIQTGKIKITGFGIFVIRRVKDRKTFNVGKGDGLITVKSHNKLGFLPSKKLKEIIQKYELLRKIYPPLVFRKVNKPWEIEPDLRSVKI